jgi:hypothetical protein
MALTFGVEIECLVPNQHNADTIAREITAAGVQCVNTGYTHQHNHVWKVVTDASLSPERGYGCHEIVSPVLTIDRLSEIDKVGEALAALKAKVNRTCGLHVHVGLADVSLGAMKALVKTYIEGEEIIDQLIPPSRRGNANNFCASLKSDGVIAKIDAAGSRQEIAAAIRFDGYHRRGSRFVKLNLASRHNTVEFRHHSGTVDPVKIKNWALFCMKMVETAKRDAEAPATSVAATVTTAIEVSRRWTRGAKWRTMYQMLTRPEGVTGEELRFALGLTQAPGIPWHVNQAGGAYTREFNRNRPGRYVYRLVTGAPAVAAAPTPTTEAIATLDALLDKLQVTAQERVYWIERAAMLSPNRE